MGENGRLIRRKEDVNSFSGKKKHEKAKVPKSYQIGWTGELFVAKSSDIYLLSVIRGSIATSTIWNSNQQNKNQNEC